MKQDSKKVKCGKCGSVLDEPVDVMGAERKPCPTCGSLSRHIEVVIGDELSTHTMVQTKARHGKKSRPFLEVKKGDDLYRKTGRWMKLEMTVDRENNWHEKVVTDLRTGEIVYKCAEPLSEHKGHGSAKHGKVKEQSDDA